ncbi:hypothetical protein [Streptomyces sp. NPDC086782]|uniref:hypothetical protein n=1 Tax=Streptomyces sp. NPDC086782 TaxID=3365757 RepID=UPI00381200BE
MYLLVTLFLNLHFNQPVFNGYFLTAERIAASLPEDRRTDILERVVADVLDSGKEMHPTVTANTTPSRPKPGRRRHAVQAEATLPAQHTQ